MLITQNFNVSNEESATNNSNIETANTAPNDPPPISDDSLNSPSNNIDCPDERRVAVDLIIKHMVPMDGLTEKTTADQTLMDELADQIITKLVPMNGISSLTIKRVNQITEGQSAIIKMDLVIHASDSNERVGKPDNRVSDSDERVGKPDNRVSGSDERVGKPDNRVSGSDERVGKPDNRVSDSDERVGKPDNRVSDSDERVGKPDNRELGSDERVGKPDNR
jgi:hypothetical protein